MPDATQMARDVLSYFLRNPQTADNLEGVARWRLLSQTIYRNVEETNQVLEWLVCQGFLLKITRHGSEPVFCLNQAKRFSAEEFLAGSESGKQGARRRGSAPHTSVK